MDAFCQVSGALSEFFDSGEFELLVSGEEEGELCDRRELALPTIHERIESAMKDALANPELNPLTFEENVRREKALLLEKTPKRGVTDRRLHRQKEKQKNKLSEAKTAHFEKALRFAPRLRLLGLGDELIESWHCAKVPPYVKFHREAMRNFIVPALQYQDADAITSQDLSCDVLYKVAVYRPSATIKKYFDEGLVSQSFLVLGSQSIDVLFDRIYCLHEEIAPERVASDRYFFIENVFLCGRESESESSSSRGAQTALRWCESVASQFSKDKKEAFGLISAKRARFSDLGIVIGKPYLYCHLGGCCEHRIVFEEQRLRTPADPKLYPFQTFQGEISRRNCCVCAGYADVVVHGSIVNPTDPAHYCTECYVSMHYDGDGNLAVNSDFEVFEYHHEW